jgi:hypothetical protein
MSIARESLAYDDEEENLRMMDLLMKEEATLPPSSYQPQLMDEHAMSDLKRHLAKSQARLASDGYLREFAPRKPSTSSVLRGTRPRLNGDSCRLISSAPMPMTASTSPEAHPETSQTKAKADVNMTPRSAIAASQARRKVEYNAALRREVHTIRGRMITFVHGMHVDLVS